MKPLLRAYCVFVMFSALAYSFWFNLLGTVPAVGLSIALTVVSAIIWIRTRSAERSAPRDRLVFVPVLLYMGFAVISVAWSSWASTTLITLVVQAAFVVQALFLVRTLDGRGLRLVLEQATAIVVGLSLIIEVVVSLVGRPLLPVFIDPASVDDPHVFWVRGNLLDGFLTGGRIQGIVGNSNMLAAICVVALIVAVVGLVRSSRRGVVLRSLLIAVSLWLGIRAGSAAMFVAVALIVLVAVLVLVRRRLTSVAARRWLAIGSGAGFLALAAVAVVAREQLFEVLGRTGSLTGRAEIWEKVLARASESPVIGHGYATPWIPWDPAFDGWIVDHGLTVFHSHNMWFDVYLQLGAIGVALLALLFGAAGWRSWRTAVADGAPVTAIIPVLLVVLLLVQGLTESAPIMFWGLGMVVALSVLRPSASQPAASFSGAASA